MTTNRESAGAVRPTRVSRPSDSVKSTRPSIGPDQARAVVPERGVLRPHADDDVRGQLGRTVQVEPDVAEDEPRTGPVAFCARRREAHRRAADEAGDERVRRVGVDAVRVADLLEDALAHDRDAVAHRHRLDLVVGDVDRRRPDLPLQSLDLAARLRPQLRVEVRERLVHQENLRLAHDRPPERDALALSSRELARLAVEQRSISSSSAARSTRRPISSLDSFRIRSPKARFWRTLICG